MFSVRVPRRPHIKSRWKVGKQLDHIAHEELVEGCELGSRQGGNESNFWEKHDDSREACFKML